MMKPLIVRDTIMIDNTAKAVWDCLVNPEKTKQYMFGCATRSTWKVDSSLEWIKNENGQDRVLVKGNIIEIEPPRYLAFTTFRPGAGIEDIPENYLTVTYELYNENGKTVLTISQGDFGSIENGEARYQLALSEGGWMPLLKAIKSILDTHG